MALAWRLGVEGSKTEPLGIRGAPSIGRWKGAEVGLGVLSVAGSLTDPGLLLGLPAQGLTPSHTSSLHSGERARGAHGFPGSVTYTQSLRGCGPSVPSVTPQV